MNNMEPNNILTLAIAAMVVFVGVSVVRLLDRVLKKIEQLLDMHRKKVMAETNRLRILAGLDEIPDD